MGSLIVSTVISHFGLYLVLMLAVRDVGSRRVR
jgi:hypothetical protein